MRDWNCKAIISTGSDLIITSDTSKLGWGAEDSRPLDSGGKEPSHKCFGTELRSFCPEHICPESEKNVHIHLKMYNQTAVAYIQKIGGGGVTNSVQIMPTTRGIWQFCLGWGTFLSAEYLSGSLNNEADWQSRNF